MGGSGRQSLTRIAAFMAEYSLFTIEISRSYTLVEWREDLRSVLKRAGAQVGGCCWWHVSADLDTVGAHQSIFETISAITQHQVLAHVCTWVDEQAELHVAIPPP